MAGMTSLIGAGVGLAGSLLGGSSQPKIKWNPMGTSNLWGSTSFDKKKKQITQNLSPWASGMAGQWQAAASDPASAALGLTGRNIQTQAAGDILGNYGAIQNFGELDPAIYEGTMSGLGQYANAFGNLFNASANNPYAQRQMQLGEQFLGAQPRSYADVAASQLGLLREQAAPFEERATNSLFQRMYGMGQLGNPGGQLAMESFGRGLGQADTARALQANQFAEDLYGRDLQAALQQQSLGANLFSSGVGNFFQGLGQAGQFGQLGMGALGSMYDLGTGYNQLGYSRAADRLARTSDLFGFGSQLAQMPAQEQAQYMNLLSGITNEQQQMAQLGLSAAGPSAPTGGSSTGQSVGGFLQGLGGGMLTGKIDPGSWFGGGGNGLMSRMALAGSEKVGS